MHLFLLSERNDTKVLFCEEKYSFHNILCDIIIVIIIIIITFMSSTLRNQFVCTSGLWHYQQQSTFKMHKHNLEPTTKCSRLAKCHFSLSEKKRETQYQGALNVHTYIWGRIVTPGSSHKAKAPYFNGIHIAGGNLCILGTYRS